VVNVQENEAIGAEKPLTISDARVKRIGLIAVVIIALVLLLALVVRHRRMVAREREQNSQDAPMAVSVVPVSSGEIIVRIPGLGAVTPLATVTVRTQISGQLQKIAFTEGQLVHEGDFVAQIDPRPYQAALDQMKANLRRDQALLADARLDLKRYQDLIAEDSIAQQQLDTQRSLVAQYEGTVAGDEAQINTAALNLQYTHIVSPVTGRVGLRQVDQGNYVTPTDANGIVVITQLQPITAIFSVPEDFVPSIVRNLHDGATLTVEAYDRSNSNKLAVGKLLTLDNEIDSTTGTIKLRALFDNKDGLLFPNQFVNIQLISNVLRNQIVMPNAAVHRGAPNGVVGTFVYLVKADNTVAVRPVTLGTVDGERVAVLAGLAPGDLVVTDGGDRLRDGAAIVLPASARPRSVAAK
jgi:multidrug efflux system membrane fusion protein